MTLEVVVWVKCTTKYDILKVKSIRILFDVPSFCHEILMDKLF